MDPALQSQMLITVFVYVTGRCCVPNEHISHCSIYHHDPLTVILQYKSRPQRFSGQSGKCQVEEKNFVKMPCCIWK